MYNIAVKSFLELLFYSILAISFVKNSLWVFLLILHILLDSSLVMVEHDFFVDEIFIVLFFKTIDFKVEVKCTHIFGCWLVIWEVKLTHIGMLKSFIHSDSLHGVEGQHLFDKVNGIWVRSLENSCKVFSFPSWQTLNEFFIF